MPSRNSVNKPLGLIKKALHERRLASRRATRVTRPTRSSAGKHNPNVLPGPSDPKGLSFYTGLLTQKTGVTTQTLLNKKKRKLERNGRYIATRNDLLSMDLAAQKEGMDINRAPAEKREKSKKPETQLDKVKQALWTVVEDFKSNGLSVESLGEGTTLGVQAF